MRGLVRAAAAGVVAALLVLSPAAVAGPRKLPPVDTANAGGCDFLDQARCLFPFPNDYFTRRDESTPTDRRLDFETASMPANRFGVRIEASDYNWSDGFSQGQLIVTKVPGLDSPKALRRTGAVPITNIGAYKRPDAPVIVLDAGTGERWPIFAEVDVNPGDPADRALLIRPAINFAAKHRYIVALRDLRRADGTRIPASAAFRYYRDRVPTEQAAVGKRRRHFERAIFKPLAAAGIRRGDLHLAWDFTVESDASPARRVLSMRKRAFAQLGDTRLSDLKVQGASPQFAVTGIEEFAPCGGDGCQAGEDDELLRIVTGNVTVPCFLDQPGCPTGSRFALSGNGLPTRMPGNNTAANFKCIVPRAAAGPRKLRPSLYGHGLLGSADEVLSSKLRAVVNRHGMLFCASDWTGMSEGDVPNVITILQDLSRFPTLADRLQQGMLNFLFLGRTMIHPSGLGDDPAFQVGGQSVIDTRRLFYAGGSQGGIIGGALTAVAPDFTRAALGVPGMNYSTLLERSVDFDDYAHGNFGGADTPLGLYDNYPDELERPLILSLVELLWERGESNGYAHRMTTRPFANTPAHTVLLQEAFGDHQVANITTEVMARTIGAKLRKPVLDPGRSRDKVPLWGIPRIERYPYRGSAISIWDVGPLRIEGSEEKGTPPPPPFNFPNREGVDPHGPDASETREGQRQISEFLRIGGLFRSVCGVDPCYLDDYGGP
jgi:hypothetical protein